MDGYTTGRAKKMLCGHLSLFKISHVKNLTWSLVCGAEGKIRHVRVKMLHRRGQVRGQLNQGLLKSLAQHTH